MRVHLFGSGLRVMLVYAAGLALLALAAGCRRPPAPAAAPPAAYVRPAPPDSLALDGPQRVQVWTTKDGLPVNFLMGVRRSHDGYLWLNTSSGLVRFDGREMKLFGQESLPGFASVHLLHLHATRTGTVLFVSNAGDLGLVERGRPRLLRRGTPGDGGAEPYEDAAGAVWMSVGTTVFRYRNGMPLDSFRADAPLYTVAPLGRTMCGFERAFACFDGHRFRRVDGLPAPYHTHLFDDGQRLLTIGEDGVVRVMDSHRVHAQHPTPLAGARPVGLMPDGTALLFLTGVGLVRLRVGEGPPEVLVPAADLWTVESERSIAALPGPGIAWLSPPDASERVGLNVMPRLGGPVQRLRLPPGIAPYSINQWTAGPSGDVWWATADGLVRTLPARAETWGQAQGLGASPFVATLARDASGTLFVGTLGSGLYR